MLRLSPTRITLDAQDIERHAINGKKIIKQMNSKSMKKPNVFGYPFPPLAKSQSMAVQEFINETKVRSEEMDSQYRISEQLLRDTLFPKRKGDQSYDKLNKWSKLEPASRKLAPVQRNIQGLNSFDGLFESHRPPLLGLKRVASIVQKSQDCHSRNQSARTSSINSEIQDLTIQISNLCTGTKELRANSPGRDPSSSQGHGRHRVPATSVREPILPPPFSQTPRAASIRFTSPIFNQYSRPDETHASATVSSRHSTRPGVHLSHGSGADRFHQHQSTDVPSISPFNSSPGRIPQQYSSPELPEMGRYLFQVSSPNGSNSSIISSRGHNWRRRPTSSILNASPGIPSTPSFHSSPPLLPSSVGLRRRTGLPVYNDSLPSESQPQTSIELSRHRLPFNQLSMTWTAPQPRSRRSWFLPPTSPTHRSQRRATPTAMLGIGTPIQLLPNERDQENAAMYAEWERRQLAAAERRQAIRRGGDVLEGTPPRDPDISF